MSQEKTEKPTPKKLKDARERGEVPRSKDLPSVMVLIFAFSYFLGFGTKLKQDISLVFYNSFIIRADRLTSPVNDFGGDIAKALSHIISSLSIFFAGCILIAFIGNCALSGFIFSGKKLKPDFSKLNPIKGLQKIFSMNQLIELLKSLLKVILIAIPLTIVLEPKYWAFANNRRTLPPLEAIQVVMLDITKWGLIFSSLYLIIVFIDVPFQIFNFNKQQKMSKQEIKDEYKNSEGNPEIKSKRRQIQMAMARKSSRNRVQEADIIITNPTHYAVGLKYNANEMEVPCVVALGADEIALAIRRTAYELNIPILEIPPLARVLYKITEVGDELPPDLYEPVASVIAYIYALDDRLAHNITQDFIDKLKINEKMF